MCRENGNALDIGRTLILVGEMVDRIGITIRWLALGFALLQGAMLPRAAAGEILALPPMRIGPGYFTMAAATDPDTGKVREAEVAWASRELPQLKRGDRLVFIDGHPVAGMRVEDFEAYARAERTPGGQIVLVFKGTRGWVRKHEVTVELAFVGRRASSADAAKER